MTRALPLLLALAACTPPENYVSAGNPDVVMVVTGRGYAAYVQIVDVDGVRCAVLVGFKGNAIDCDFGGGE